MEGVLFQSFWHGPLTPYELLCLKSFVDHGHPVRLYGYDRPESLPAGCVWHDAAPIVPRDQLFRYRDGFGAGSVAGFANRFRYELLLARGGWWIDADMLCLSPHWPDAARQAGREDDRLVNVAAIRAPAGDPLIAAALKTTAALGRDVVWGQTGPQLFTRLLAGTAAHGYTIHPPEIFYPLDYRAPSAFLAPGGSSFAALADRGAVGLHLWNAMLLGLGIDKYAAPPPGSLLHAAFARHGLLGQFTRGYGFDPATLSLTAPQPL